MGNTWVPKEAYYTAWGSSYINVLPEGDWKPYERIRLGRSLGREWTSWAKRNWKCHEWKSLQESYACPQDYSAIIVTAANASSARILADIQNSSMKSLILLALPKFWSTDNIPVVRAKCQLQVLVELVGNGIYSAHVHSGSDRGDMGRALAQSSPNAAKFLSDLTIWIMQDGD